MTCALQDRVKAEPAVELEGSRLIQHFRTLSVLRVGGHRFWTGTGMRKAGLSMPIGLCRRDKLSLFLFFFLSVFFSFFLSLFISFFLSFSLSLSLSLFVFVLTRFLFFAVEPLASEVNGPSQVLQEAAAASCHKCELRNANFYAGSQFLMRDGTRTAHNQYWDINPRPACSIGRARDRILFFSPPDGQLYCSH